MGTPIYKISEYIDWQSKSPVLAVYTESGAGLPSTPVDLSNYYTKTDLQTEGSAIVDWTNIANAPEVFWELNISSELVPTTADRDIRTLGDMYANDFILIP